MQASSIIAVLAMFQSSYGCLTEHLAKRARESNAGDCIGGNVSTNSQFAVVNAQVFNGTHFEPPQTVLVSGKNIEKVGGQTPSGVKIVDGTGKYLIPGLIDSHVHPSSCTDLSDLAGYGITTAVNMACLNYTTCAQLKGQVGTADYITAGEIACGTGTIHATIFGVPAGETVGPDTDLSTLVDWTFGNGSDFFKIIAEDKGPTLEQQSTMVQLARDHNSFAATHATLMEFYEQAIQSKVDGIQHTPADAILSSDQINQIKSQSQFVTPTMELYRVVFANPVLKSTFGFNSSSNYSNIQTNVANMHRSGIPIAAGTDSIGSIPLLINYPFGRSLHCELQNLVDVGFGNAEVIQAATGGAASLYRLKDRGSISAGMRADLILLNSNPISNITNSLDIASSWAAGVKISNITAMRGQTCDPSSLAF